MKRIIATAALFAAGTALANALTIADASYSFTDDSVVSTPSVSGTGSFAITFTLNSDGVADLIALQSKSGKSATDTANYLSMGVSSATIGTSSGYSSTNNTSGIFFSQSAAGTGHNTSNPNYHNGSVSDLYFVTSSTASTIDSIAVTISHEMNGGNGNGSYIGITYIAEDGTATTKFSNDSGLKWSSFTSSTSWGTLAVNTDYVDSVYVFSQLVNDSSTMETLNRAAIAAIPEPSAFGLLAGAGALALVAARRRRSRAK